MLWGAAAPLAAAERRPRQVCSVLDVFRSFLWENTAFEMYCSWKCLPSYIQKRVLVKGVVPI